MVKQPRKYLHGPMLSEFYKLHPHARGVMKGVRRFVSLFPDKFLWKNEPKGPGGFFALDASKGPAPAAPKMQPPTAPAASKVSPRMLAASKSTKPVPMQNVSGIPLVDQINLELEKRIEKKKDEEGGGGAGNNTGRKEGRKKRGRKKLKTKEKNDK